MPSYADCVNDMDLAAEKLRNNPYINYKQLGLQFKLYSYEVRRQWSKGSCGSRG